MTTPRELDVVEADRADEYDRIYSMLARDTLLDELALEALGDDYPQGLQVHSSCTPTNLEVALTGLRLPRGGVFADLGCGLGGPGRWLARATGARVIGLDVSQVAVDEAAASASGCLATGQYEYRRATFAATALPDASGDGVLAIETLAAASDRGAALAEVRRILKPGGRASFTGGEWHGEIPRPGGRPVIRWAPLIAEAGLEIVDVYEDRTRSERWRKVFALWLDREDAIRARLGDAAEGFIQEARDAPSVWVPEVVGFHFTVQRSG